MKSIALVVVAVVTGQPIADSRLIYINLQVGHSSITMKIRSHKEPLLSTPSTDYNQLLQAYHFSKQSRP